MSGRWLNLFCGFIRIFPKFFRNFLSQHLMSGEICLSPFVYNQTNTTWTPPLPSLPCPSPFGHGTFTPSRYIPGKLLSFVFFTPNPFSMSPGAPQHAQATCLPWKFVSVLQFSPMAIHWLQLFFLIPSLSLLSSVSPACSWWWVPSFICYFIDWLVSLLSTAGTAWVSAWPICLLVGA